MMRLKESFVSLDGLRFHAFHGVLPQERTVGNDYVVDVRVGYDVSSACLSDEVADTLNYARMFDIVKDEMAESSNLLERVAWRIGEKLMAEFPAITSLIVRLTKQNPPMRACGDGATVELHLINDKT